ncbi:carbon monoxide dehydrogenase, medium subunit [Stappia aggregata IAM 12614]|uniref:Carbon monoxide dehydrogenase, medium subunit n=1 Tax=Roseibium aggregatum (strain ATCC 25650 / DSM 13394 / JCM 20685 / NBRC 16684 / NCIMB 2208 / IAM 12614 / B1) TaxID=384765 RepID=A0NSQ8_ROSAI|nr:carbon monoxide dehydrogenase, medium subunit [Stappia aggregata IAM 12614] [Roseibium aggregatum IAM 12614]
MLFKRTGIRPLGGRQREEKDVIPGAFTYHRPSSVAEAVAILVSHGDEARPLSGGHSLIPMMKLRMAAPEHLVDLGGIADLKGITDDGDTITIRAMTTQHELIASDLLAQKLPIIRETSLLIADPQIRYVGTLGGNVANGDPGNDMPALMQCLDAAYVLTGPEGDREVPARDFYEAAYFTTLAPDEILTAVRIPVPPAGHGYAYEKLKRKVGDYATAAAAVVLTLDGGTVSFCSIALTNVADTPLYAQEAGEILTGSTLDAETVARAVAAAEEITEPASDGRGPAEYRTKMAGVMLQRALARAATRAAS